MAKQNPYIEQFMDEVENLMYKHKITNLLLFHVYHGNIKGVVFGNESVDEDTEFLIQLHDEIMTSIRPADKIINPN